MNRIKIMMAVAFAMTVGVLAGCESAPRPEESPVVIYNGTTAGTAGIDGKDGVDGKDGAPGANGTNGKDGTNGTNGKDGKNGVDGISCEPVTTPSGCVAVKCGNVTSSSICPPAPVIECNQNSDCLGQQFCVDGDFVAKTQSYCFEGKCLLANVPLLAMCEYGCHLGSCNTPVPPAPDCAVDGDCDNGDPKDADTCVSGTCVHTIIPVVVPPPPPTKPTQCSGLTFKVSAGTTCVGWPSVGASNWTFAAAPATGTYSAPAGVCSVTCTSVPQQCGGTWSGLTDAPMTWTAPGCTHLVHASGLVDPGCTWDGLNCSMQ